jgi:hypothetical protein
MIPSESAPQDLSNEWSCQFDNLKFLLAISVDLLYCAHFLPLDLAAIYYGLHGMYKVHLFAPGIPALSHVPEGMPITSQINMKIHFCVLELTGKCIRK